MEKAFSLKGRIMDDSNNALPDIFLAIADEDSLDGADLIGLGTTNAKGEFGISFLGSEFRQDWFEDEKTPNIFIVISAMFGEERKAIFHKRFPKLEWTDHKADLGDIILEGVDLKSPKALSRVEAIPGGNKRAARLDIDDSMVWDCLKEVAPIVEELTGWKGLLDELKVEVASSLSPYMLRESFVSEGIDPNSWDAKFTTFFTDFAQGPGAGCGLYDPHIHTIVINKKIMSQVGIEGLKVICGHELVHVGQYKYTLGLKEFNLDHLRGMKINPENFDPVAAKAKASYMTELEGYAKYIETDFLHKKYYPLALLSYHASTWEQIMQAMMSMMVANNESQKEAKANQYTDGLAVYRERQVGDKPVRFQLDVASLPGGAEIMRQLSKEKG